MVRCLGISRLLSLVLSSDVNFFAAAVSQEHASQQGSTLGRPTADRVPKALRSSRKPIIHNPRLVGMLAQEQPFHAAQGSSTMHPDYNPKKTSTSAL